MAACGGGRESAVRIADLDELAGKSAMRVRAFDAKVTSGASEVTVNGVVEDDYRYTATVSVNGKPAWEEVVIDDARYLRVLDASPLFEPEAAVEVPTMHAAFPAILAGGWVVDANGAPAEFTPDATVVPLAPDLVLSQVRVLDTVPRLVKLGYAEWNPDGASYLPKYDKFPAHKGDGKRFDHLPGAYDANQVMNGLDSLRPYFEFASVWATEAGVTRIEQRLELPDPADKRYAELYDQLRRSGSRRLLALLQTGRAGRTLGSSYVIRAAGEQQHVAEPTGAVAVDLGGAITALRQRLAAFAVPSPLYGPIP
jgi:hypothetical protein